MLSSDMQFTEAASLWLSDHAQYIKPGTLRVYKQYVKSLSEFFGALPLGKMHIGHVRAYQRARLERAGHTRINAEVQSALIPMLREVNLWKGIADVYRALPAAKKKVRQTMSPDEERRFLCVALDGTKRRRLLAGHCLVVMENTSMGFGELRFLKREDVVLDEQIPYVTVNEGTKNDYRIRTIPLNWMALRSMRWIVKRWADLGGTAPTQYILPHHAKRTPEERAGRGHKRKSPPDFSQPMGHIYNAARGIFRDAGLKLVPYDMRSCAVTKVLSDPSVSDQMAEEIIGHSDTFTKRRYSRQRLEKKAVAMEKLALDPAPQMKFVVFPGGRK